ncbi:MAG TPA: tRNA lysidine(34) synthetase TilS [Bdellovibrionales bacterium]|nr:tRNA lysidine(34) synthetase TilS [Bdellovibrionales bacterium]
MSREDLAFEHKILRVMKSLKTKPRRALVAVSGGVDSITLLHVLARWRRGLDLDPAVAHGHHGLDPRHLEFRNASQELVRNVARDLGLRFFSNDPEVVRGKSEADLRAYRDEHLLKWRKEFQADGVFFAHHLDDLLETRVLRLLRGTGPEGLGAMRVRRAHKYRPMLGVSRAEIESYAISKNLKWIEDPSNVTGENLRSWLRKEWIPALERKRSGAKKALARSLATLSIAKQGWSHADFVGLRRSEMKKASSQERRALIASYLRGLGVKNYGHTHVNEILKRVDTRRKNLSFTILELEFTLTPDLLWASRV